MNPYSIKKSVHWHWLSKVLAWLFVSLGNEGGEQGPSPSWFACGYASELSLLVKSETNDSRSLCLDNHLLVKPFIKHSNSNAETTTFQTWHKSLAPNWAYITTLCCVARMKTLNHHVPVIHERDKVKNILSDIQIIIVYRKLIILSDAYHKITWLHLYH